MYDYLLISLLLYDEVSAFLLLVKARTSSFLIGRSFCLSEVFTFAAPRVTWSSLLSLSTNKTQREHVFLCRTSLKIILFQQVGTNFLQSLEFLFYRRLKNVNNFRVVVLGPRLMTRGLTFRKINGNNL